MMIYLAGVAATDFPSIRSVVEISREREVGRLFSYFGLLEMIHNWNTFEECLRQNANLPEYLAGKGPERSARRESI